jgi:nitrile hydratase subunit beta
MDGVHDMGGMQGFGSVDPSPDQPLSKTDWRARMFGIELSYIQPGGFNLDWMRHVMECMPPSAYLSSEYFDRWCWRDAAILTNAGWVGIDELMTGKAAFRPANAGGPPPPDAVPAILSQGVDSRRPSQGLPAFKPGDRVRAKFHSPLGATRLPRYLRGHIGAVEAYHGWHRLPDVSAHVEEQAEPLWGLLDSAVLDERRRDWEEAYRRTPHGQPIVLTKRATDQER